MKQRRFLIGLVAIAAGVAPAMPGTLPTISQPISSREVHDMYAGKTWVWKDISTGIYFQPSGALLAYENAPDERLGKGTWTVDEKGNLCVNVRWQKAAGGRTRYKSCWGHRKVGHEVWKQHFQRNRWYSLFGRSNEARRITPGNHLQALREHSIVSR